MNVKEFSKDLLHVKFENDILIMFHSGMGKIKYEKTSYMFFSIFCCFLNKYKKSIIQKYWLGFFTISI